MRAREACASINFEQLTKNPSADVVNLAMRRDYPWQPKKLRTHTNQCNNCHLSPALTEPLRRKTVEQQRLAGVLANYATYTSNIKRSVTARGTMLL